MCKCCRDNCFECCKKNCGFKCALCCSKIPIKRYFLPFLGIFVLLGYEFFQNYSFLPIIFFVGCVIIFWNFPFIIYAANSKTIYIQDLFIDDARIPNYEVSTKLKVKFQTIFLWTLIITDSIAVAALADYWLYKSTTINLDSYVEVLGVTGGVLKIFSTVNHYVGKLLIKILHKVINDEHKKNREKIRNQFKSSIDQFLNSKIILSEKILESPALMPIKESELELIEMKNDKINI